MAEMNAAVPAVTQDKAADRAEIRGSRRAARPAVALNSQQATRPVAAPSNQQATRPAILQIKVQAALLAAAQGSRLIEIPAVAQSSRQVMPQAAPLRIRTATQIQSKTIAQKKKLVLNICLEQVFSICLLKAIIS